MEFTLDLELVRSILKQEQGAAGVEIRALGVLPALERSGHRHDARIAAAPDVRTLACAPPPPVTALPPPLPHARSIRARRAPRRRALGLRGGAFGGRAGARRDGQAAAPCAALEGSGAA